MVTKEEKKDKVFSILLSLFHHVFLKLLTHFAQSPRSISCSKKRRSWRETLRSPHPTPPHLLASSFNYIWFCPSSSHFLRFSPARNTVGRHFLLVRRPSWCTSVVVDLVHRRVVSRSLLVSRKTYFKLREHPRSKCKKTAQCDNPPAFFKGPCI